VSIEDLIHIHHEQGVALLQRNVGNPKSNKDELLLGMRHLMCSWILDEATPEQLLQIVETHKRSPFN
jgi:hypothetical protein